MLPRWLVVALGIIALFAIALTSLATVTVREAFPRTEGEVSSSAISGRVDIVRDELGIPQIYADTPEDLFAAQGYVAAQERFFEMDFRRHVTAGRLAELFGPEQVETDAFIRTMGWRRVAQAELGMLSPTSQRYLEAYTAGVNDWMAGRATEQMSVEYAILGLTGLRYRPEPWTSVDSLAWLKAMAWSLDGNNELEVERATLLKTLPADQVDRLFPPQDPDIAPIVTDGAVSGGAFRPGDRAANRRELDGLPAPAQDAIGRAGRLGQAVPGLLGETGDGGAGSNSWVVSGEHTASGRPILSNDPHLGTSIPSPFMQVGLHCRAVGPACPYDVSGFAFAGVPGVIIGHNARIAWGLTTPNLDTQDLVVERIRGGRVVSADGAEDLQVRTEEIRVRGEERPRPLQVRVGPRGPLISDVDAQLAALPEPESAGGDESGDEYAVALNWTALRPTPSIDAVFALNRAGNFDEFRDAAAMLRSPAQNLIYADVDGNIGYQLPGDVPIRDGYDGSQPTLGWTRRTGWTGMVPFAELPYAYNPPSGRIVAANQSVVEAYPRPLQAGQSYGWRSQAISDRLAGQPRIDLDFAQSLFTDESFRLTEPLLPLLRDSYLADPWVREARDLLRTWDGRMAADSAGAAYFALTVRAMITLTFDDELPPELRASGGDRRYAALAELLKHPDDPWWDDVNTPQRERRDDIIARALLRARKEGVVLMSNDIDTWRWGRLHTIGLRHQTLGSSGVAPVERLFNPDPAPVGGGSAIVEAWGWDATSDNFRVTAGPAMRMLVDLSDLDNSRWVNQSGTSGHAGHENYDDQFELMITNRLQPFPFSVGAVDAAATRRMWLIPR